MTENDGTVIIRSSLVIPEHHLNSCDWVQGKPGEECDDAHNNYDNIDEDDESNDEHNEEYLVVKSISLQVAGVGGMIWPRAE